MEKMNMFMVSKSFDGSFEHKMRCQNRLTAYLSIKRGVKIV